MGFSLFFYARNLGYGVRIGECLEYLAHGQDLATHVYGNGDSLIVAAACKLRLSVAS